MSSSITLNNYHPIAKICDIRVDISKLQQLHMQHPIEQYVYKLEKIDIVGDFSVRKYGDNLFISITKIELSKDCTVAEIDLLQNLMLDMFDENIKLIYNKMIDGLGDYLFKQSFNMLFDLETFYSARSSYFAHLCTIYKNITTTS